MTLPFQGKFSCTLGVSSLPENLSGTLSRQVEMSVFKRFKKILSIIPSCNFYHFPFVLLFGVLSVQTMN